MKPKIYKKLPVTAAVEISTCLFYRFYHWAHHRHTGDLLKDPELQNTLLDMDISTLSGTVFCAICGAVFTKWVTQLVEHSFFSGLGVSLAAGGRDVSSMGKRSKFKSGKKKLLGGGNRLFWQIFRKSVIFGEMYFEYRPNFVVGRK